MKLRDKMPRAGWMRMLENVNPRIPKATAVGSLVVGAIGSAVTCEELLDGIIHGAEGILDSGWVLKTR